MTKNQRDSIIAVIVVTAFIFSAFRTMKNSKRAAIPAVSTPTSSVVETQLINDAQFISAVRSTKQIADEQDGRWQQEWERDPFRAEEAVSGGGIENLVLRGVFWEEKSPRAVVNNKMLSVGETIDGYKIIEIRRNSVLLWTGEKNLELKVFGSPEDPVLSPT